MPAPRASAWQEVCRHPYRILFPLGVALSWAGIGHWLLHAAGWLPDYRPRFHAMAQTQGFMTCMAVGFLFTMIPRRTGTAPPRPWQLVMGAAAPAGMVAAAWFRQWALAQALWLAVILMLIGFIATRFGGPGESRTPNGFVWIPASLACGLVGSGLVLSGQAGIAGAAWSQVGQRLCQQGFLVALLLGVGGSLALPLMTRGQSPPAGPPRPADRWLRLGHVAAAVALAASFWIEVNVSLAVAMAVRAFVIAAVLTGEAQLWRLPQRTGANARIIWLAAWLLPVGYLLAALQPETYRAGLHVALVGGLATLGLAIAAQVLLGHGGYTEVVRGWPVSALLLAACMGLAVTARVMMEWDPARFLLWMGAAAGLFLGATVAWWFYVGRAIRSPRRDR